jgi:hypothetical protein
MAQNTKRRIAFAILFFWIIPIIACNFPTHERSEENHYILDETMAAFLSATPGEPAGDVLPVIETPAPAVIVPPTSRQNHGLLAGLRTPHPGESLGGIRTMESHSLITAQSGDTLPALALRFGVEPHQITSSNPNPAIHLDYTRATAVHSQHAVRRNILPLGAAADSEIVYSPSAADFDIAAYISQAGGYLATYGETIDGEHHTAAQSIQRAALETSTNPRILAVDTGVSVRLGTRQSAQHKHELPSGFCRI